METAPTDASRAADLARMRLVATGLLVLMAAVFLAASIQAHLWPGLAYVRAFAEAGMVGACADWFAVTALFRRPLGLPIPHTAIIPRNKDRIGQALGRFISDNFLTVAVLNERLRQLEVARWGGEWLRQPKNASRLARRLAPLLPELLRVLPRDALRDLIGAALMAAARATPPAPLAAKLLAFAWNDGRAQALFDRLIEMAGGYLASNEAFIREKVSEKSFRWLPKWIDRMIAGEITSGLVRVVEEMRAPDHPWRMELAQAVRTYVERLETDPELQAQAEALKARLLAHPALTEQAQAVWSGLEGRLGADAGEAVGARLEGWLISLGEWLSSDAAAQGRLNDWARIIALRILAPRRQEIGAFVAQVVSGWETRRVVERLELQVGRDLQFIRVNGTIVGGLVGLAIYAASRALGLG